MPPILSSPLYIDGARLITGLACPENELSLPDIADLCDIFYIGGTKAGALCGEAVVFTKNNTPAHFLTQIKQHGALLAKGRLCGIQFDALFSDDLYKETGRNAIEAAALLREGLRQKGYTFYNSSPTNQLFLVMENSRLEELKNDVVYSFWEKADDTHSAVTVAGKVLCNVPAFFEIELAKQSFLYENNIPGYIFLTNQQFSFVHLTAYKQTGNELQLLRREFMKAAGKPPRHFHVVFLSHRYRERDMPLFLQFCKIGVQQVLGSHKRSQVAL